MEHFLEQIVLCFCYLRREISSPHRAVNVGPGVCGGGDQVVWDSYIRLSVCVAMQEGEKERASAEGQGR